MLRSCYSFVVLCCAVCIFGSSSNRCQADLVAHWTGDNSAMDASGNMHDGMINGATFAPGIHGNAFSFDGVNDSVIVDADTALEPTNAFSIALWVQTIQENRTRILIDSTHGAGQAGWALQLNQANQVSFAYGNGTIFPELTAAFEIFDGSYHHLVATFDGSTMQLFLDGNPGPTLGYTGTALPSGRDIQLGNSPVLNRPLNGNLDDVRIYNHVLSQSEITTLATIPEPASAGLLWISAMGIAGMRRRSTKR